VQAELRQQQQMALFGEVTLKIRQSLQLETFCIRLWQRCSAFYKSIAVKHVLTQAKDTLQPKFISHTTIA
jgi:hypothetical protein